MASLTSPALADGFFTTGGFPGGSENQEVKNLPAKQEIWVWSSAVLNVNSKALIWTRNTFLVEKWYKNKEGSGVVGRKNIGVFGVKYT